MAEKKPTFYMMVGVPCSGKTTYARQIPNATVLSSDDIRAENRRRRQEDAQTGIRYPA